MEHVHSVQGAKHRNHRNRFLDEEEEENEQIKSATHKKNTSDARKKRKRIIDAPRAGCDINVANTVFHNREVLDENVQTFDDDDEDWTGRLAESVARASLGCNWSSEQAENPYFRQMILEISQMNLDESDVEYLLNRLRMGDSMEAYARDVQIEAKENWMTNAKTFGGSFTVDGCGTGVTFFSFESVYYSELLLTGKSKTAEDYMKNVLPVLLHFMPLISFMCTDGVSKMIKFGELMSDSYFVLPQLCAAHGFSLANHYIGKSFERAFGFITRTMGIVDFFNRSPQHMKILRKISRNGLGFVKVPKTHFAYMTFVFLRVLRLRFFAQIAMTRLAASSKAEHEFEEDSRFNRVKKALNDDDLFAQAELFVRVTLPVVFIMREFDRGVAMTGFVFWAFNCVESHAKHLLDAAVEADANQAELRDKVLTSIAWIWEKRHTPILSLAYLTNPLFHKTITAVEGHPFQLASHFKDDTLAVFSVMIKKRYPHKTDCELMAGLCTLLCELDHYFRTPLDDLQQAGAELLMASEWWSGHNGLGYPTLAYYAARIHAAPCVSSSLERSFSMKTSVYTTPLSGLSIERASLFTAAHNAMVTAASPRREVSGEGDTTVPSKLQDSLVAFVKRLERILDLNEIPDIDAEGIRDVESWMESVAATGSSLIYRDSQMILGEATFDSTEGLDSSIASTLLEELEADEAGQESAARPRVNRPLKRYTESSFS